jgi:small conductance mechanosensitive channel
LAVQTALIIAMLGAARAAIDKILAEHDHILNDPAPFVEVETLKDSSVDFLVRPFCRGEHYFCVLYSVPELMKKALMKRI